MSQADLQTAHAIISRYVDQMLYGCGDENCKQLLCDDGRKNAVGRPIRRYTPRSARTIALTLASSPQPRSRLCIQHEEQTKHARFKVDDGPRDPSSVIQLLADTQALKLLSEPKQSSMPASDTRDIDQLSEPKCSSGEQSTHARHPDLRSDSRNHVSHMRAGHGILDQADRHLGDRAHILSLVRGALCAVLKTSPGAEESTAPDSHLLAWLDAVIQRGETHPSLTSRENDSWIEYLDAFDDPLALGLLRRCLLVLGQVPKAEPDAVTHPEPALLRWKLGDWPHNNIAQWFISHTPNHSVLALTSWLKKAFLTYWDRKILLQPGIPLTCLFLIEAIFSQCIPRSHGAGLETPTFCAIELISTTVEAVEMAQTWLENSTLAGDRAVHLLEFEFLFSKADRALYFRTINHLRMQQAHNDAEKASNLRSRSVRRSYDADNDAQLVFLEDHYLLLNVSRSDILRDSFNQIWQRRSSELLRPLRVRLGEMDAFEVGHDLGGVQIEFFNLLCKEIFSEELGMFTSDPTTGLSHFRPGCLQPLYMFELFGLLFALAIYNGITLPVSFPLVFYSRLINPHQQHDLDSIRDGWPATHKSLSAILKEDIPGLDRVFPMEANGLRLSISTFSSDSVHNKMNDHTTFLSRARVAEATPIVHHPEAAERDAHSSSPSQLPTLRPAANIDPHNIHWPGWLLEPETIKNGLELTPFNKTLYVAGYISWLTYNSVAPQWQHFLLGFHRILPAHDLRIFNPSQLQSLVEGHRTLSVPDLRAATHYEGFQPHSAYINAFWSIVSSWPEPKQFQLVKFVTAAERIPVGGAGNVTFKISRVTHPGAEEQLPTSSTCFGTLMLPKYGSPEVLERKLGVALEMGGEGFGTG